jgi:undecaprenyl phosphate-alpha-L-ara4N flippase subunit ArnE
MRWTLLFLVVVTAVAGDLLQSREMKQASDAGEPVDGLAGVLKTIWGRRGLLLSIACMAVSFFAFLALVQREPLSFAVPASAATFVLETLLARFVLHEHVDGRRAAGAICVLAGIVLIAR